MFPFFNNYPGTDLHEIDLAYILKTCSEMLDRVKAQDDKIAAVEQLAQDLKDFVNNYFDNLDVQTEINNKIDTMAANGSLLTIIEDPVADAAAEWLANNITPTTPPVDATLTISGAAADAKATGDKITEFKNEFVQYQTATVKIESGGYADADGTTKRSGVTRFRNIYAIATDNIYSITIPSGYSIWVFRLDSEKVLISTYGSWITGTVFCSSIITEKTKYINFVIRNDSMPSEDISSQRSAVERGLVLKSQSTVNAEFIQYQTADVKIESGGYADADGTTKVLGLTRFRNIYTVAIDNIYSITIPSGYSIWVFGLDSERKLLRTYGTWVSGILYISSIISEISEKTKYINFVIRNDSMPSEDISSQKAAVESALIFTQNGIQSAEAGDTGIIALNRDVLPFVQSLNKSYPENAKAGFSSVYTPLTFIHFSDIHNRPALWKRIAEYADNYSEYLSFALHTGDYVGDNLTQYTDLYDYYMPAIPFLNCVGNHDTYANSNHTLAEKETVRNHLFNHTSNWNVNFYNGISNSMTYYKDFTDSNIRLIVLDNYYDIASQKTWLASTLASAKTLGYSVITAAHQVTGRPSQKINCTFQSLIPYESVLSSSTVDTEFDAVIGDFITSGGKHIVHLCGHEHQDWFYKTANGVLNCSVECATDFTDWTEGARVANTKTWDCFNAVGIDTELGIIKIVRIGANTDAYNRAKNILTYDYVNSNVISNG